MLRSSLIILTILLSNLLRAEISDPKGVFNEGNKFYEEQQYEAAASQYLQLYEEGYYSSELFQNLGNTYYKLDSTPNAILFYEKALKLAPGNDAIIHNLKLANLKVADKNNVQESIRLNDWLFTFISNTPNYWSYNSIYLTSIGFLLLIVFLFSSTVKMKKLSFYSGIIGILLGIVSVFLAGFHKKSLTAVEEGIVFKPSIELMTEPSENASVAFVLHEGSKVTLLDKNNAWYEIKFGDGKIGWLKKEYIKEI